MVHHLAQINIAHALGPLDSAIMREFTEQLDAVNALAEAASGFVWRYRDTDDDPTARGAFPDPLTIVNMSIWTDAEALKVYVYRNQHGAAFRRRKDWFAEAAGPSMALWWMPAGTRPTVAEGRRRLDLLAAHGPTAEAFTFREQFPAPLPGNSVSPETASGSESRL